MGAGRLKEEKHVAGVAAVSHLPLLSDLSLGEHRMSKATATYRCIHSKKTRHL